MKPENKSEIDRELLTAYIGRTFLNADGISQDKLHLTAASLADFVIAGEWRKAVADDRKARADDVLARIALHEAAKVMLAAELASIEGSDSEDLDDEPS